MKTVRNVISVRPVRMSPAEGRAFGVRQYLCRLGDREVYFAGEKLHPANGGTGSNFTTPVAWCSTPKVEAASRLRRDLCTPLIDRLKSAPFSVACLCLLLMTSCTGGGPSSKELNVIFIGMDTTRADHINENSELAPNINALAETGVLFENCFTVVPTTLASFTSMFSGMYPHTHRVARNGIPVSPDLDLLAERFAKAGYVTAGVAASYALHSSHGIAQGFQTYNEEFDPSIGGGPVQRSADAVNAYALPWLEQHVDDRFFLFVHYFDPHAPYAPPPPYDAERDPEAPRWDFSNLARLRQAVRAGNRPFAQRLSADVRSMYAGEVAFMDSQVGLLVDQLKKLDLFDKTLIVIVGDHGENLEERTEELFDHGRTVYDQGTHVPLIFSCPAFWTEGVTDKRIVRTIDIAPTLSTLTGMKLNDSYEGQPLLDARGQTESEQDLLVFSEATKPWDGEAEADPQWQNQNKIKCVRSANWKLILDPLTETFSLYDLQADPDEKQNVFDVVMESDPDAVRPLMIALEGWMNDLSDNAGGRKTISPEVEKQLRSLGYTR